MSGLLLVVVVVHVVIMREAVPWVRNCMRTVSPIVYVPWQPVQAKNSHHHPSGTESREGIFTVPGLTEGNVPCVWVSEIDTFHYA